MFIFIFFYIAVKFFRHTLYLFVPGKHVKSTPTDDASRLLGYTNNGDDFAYAILLPSNIFTKKSSKLTNIVNLRPAFKNELHNHTIEHMTQIWPKSPDLSN